MSITSGYTESEAAFYNPMLWYDHPQAVGMKRSAHQATLDAYSMMDTCGYYNHLQPPSVKYMKPEPVTYYHYHDDHHQERYQNTISVSAQNQVHSTFNTAAGTSLTNFAQPPPPPPPSHYTSYTSAATHAAAAAAAAAYGGTLSTDSCNNMYNISSHVVSSSPVTNSSDQQQQQQQQQAAVSPARPSGMDDLSIAAPLTPPLSVSPGAGNSPAHPHSLASNPGLPHTSSYQDKDNSSSYHHHHHHRSGSNSPCEQQGDCDSTTTSHNTDHLLAEGEIIPKLPLHVLSDLSEGLPLPGWW